MDPTIIALAKAYAYRLETHHTPQASEAYIRQHFPNQADEVYSLAIQQANQALSVGFALAQLPPDAQLRDALLGAEEPAPTVGVRVTISRQGMLSATQANPGGNAYNTVYLPMAWDDTVADVLAAVEEYVEDHWSLSGEPSGIGFRFSGPTLWPLI